MKPMIRKTISVAILAMGCLAIAAHAQMGATATPSGPVDPAKSLDAMLSSYEQEFVGLAKAMPTDKFDFAPKTSTIPGSKFDTVRTFAEQIKHVTQANYSYAAAASGLKPDTNVKAIADLKSRDEILAALAASFVFAHKAIATITSANAFDAVRGAPGTTRATAAAGIAAHGFDHYGQMVEYLRMNGIIPPASTM